MPLIDRQRVIGERMMISRVVLHEGFTVGTHAHENEQIVVCLEGKTRFTIGDASKGDDVREAILVGGQVLHLPPNIPHSAHAIEKTIILDLFSPVSEKTGVDE